MTKQPSLPALDRAVRVADKRVKILDAYKNLRAGGLTASAAARRVRVSHPTLWRWEGRADQLVGLGALPLPFFWRSGRKPDLERLGITVTAAIAKEVRLLHVKHGSATAAWRAFARSRECPARLSEYLTPRLRRGYLPPSLARVTGLQRIRLRAFQAGGRVFIPAQSGTEFIILHE